MCQGQQPGSGPFGSSAGSSGGMNYSGQRTMAPNYPGAQNYAQYRLGMMPSFTPGAPGAFGRSGSQPTNTPGSQGGGGYPGGAGYPAPPTLDPNGGTGGGSPRGDPAAQMGVGGGRFDNVDPYQTPGINPGTPSGGRFGGAINGANWMPPTDDPLTAFQGQQSGINYGAPQGGGPDMQGQFNALQESTSGTPNNFQQSLQLPSGPWWQGGPGASNGMNKPAMETGGPPPWAPPAWGRGFGRGNGQSPPWMGRTDIGQPAQQNPMDLMRQNYNSVAGFQMPGAMNQPQQTAPSMMPPNMTQSAGYVGQSMSQPGQMTPAQWQTQNASMIRPGTVQDPATMAGSAPKPTPPMPQGQMQPGQSDWQYNAGFQNGSPGTGWVPGYFPSEQQYISNNMPNFSQQQLGQLNYQDLINSIGQVSGNPYNQSIYGPRR